MMILKPSLLLEVSTGFLLPLFGLMVVFACLRLRRYYKEALSLYRSKRWAWYYTYATYKPTVAIVILSISLFIRFGFLWLWMHMILGRNFPGAENETMLGLFVVSTMLVAFAIVCWIRSVSPIEIFNWQWVIIVLLCLLLAVGFSVG